jgi:hypothetical protein
VAGSQSAQWNLLLFVEEWGIYRDETDDFGEINFVFLLKIIQNVY